MANFSKKNFIIPIGVDSTSLRIRDTKGQLKHTILNNSNTTFFNTGNFVIIRTTGDTTDIRLDFTCRSEAVQALTLLNSEFANLKRNISAKKKSDFLDQIDDIIGGGTGGGTGGGAGFTPNVEPRKYLFTNETDADKPIEEGQLVFQMPDYTSKIHSVYINGVVINDYLYNKTYKTITIDPSMIGYGIESDDEVMVNYFV
jgi:hypothetical protein